MIHLAGILIYYSTVFSNTSNAICFIQIKHFITRNWCIVIEAYVWKGRSTLHCALHQHRNGINWTMMQSKQLQFFVDVVVVCVGGVTLLESQHTGVNLCVWFGYLKLQSFGKQVLWHRICASKWNVCNHWFFYMHCGLYDPHLFWCESSEKWLSIWNSQ